MTKQNLALIPRSNRLSRLKQVSAAQLKREEAFSDPCPPLPMDEILDRVAVGKLIVAVGATSAWRLPDSVLAIPLTDTAATRLIVEWTKTSPHPELATFVRQLQRLAGPLGSARN